MKINRLLPRVFLAVAFCFALISGMAAAKLAGAQVCPEDCKQYNLDLDKDGRVTVSDAMMLMKCVKSQCNDPALDVNGDTIVDPTDYQILTDCMKKGCTK